MYDPKGAAAGDHDRSFSAGGWNHSGSVAAAGAPIPLRATCHQQQISKQVGLPKLILTCVHSVFGITAIYFS